MWVGCISSETIKGSPQVLWEKIPTTDRVNGTNQLSSENSNQMTWEPSFTEGRALSFRKSCGLLLIAALPQSRPVAASFLVACSRDYSSSLKQKRYLLQGDGVFHRIEEKD